MHRALGGLLCAALVCGFAMAACGSGEDEGDDGTPAASATARRTGTVSAAGSITTPVPETTRAENTATAAPASASTQPASTSGSAPPPPPPPPPPPAGRVYSASDAQAIIQSAVLGAGDMPGPGWSVMSDVLNDNATAAAADPVAGASFERCGRLTGRLVTMQPPADQLVAMYLGGQSVSFFTLLNVYATEAGAIDCAIESAQRFSQPGELAGQFKNIFIDTNAVVVTPVDFPQVGDGSFAVTLAGKIRAQGAEVNLTILLVAFRNGNVSAVVGSAAAGAPTTGELSPRVNAVIQRIDALQ